MTLPVWKIAVVFGGTSMERDVSVASAAQVIKALRSRGHAVTAIDAASGLLSRDEEVEILTNHVEREPPGQLDSSNERVLAKLLDAGAFSGFDLAFLALHGGTGEDGTVQALLDTAGICYTGTGSASSCTGDGQEPFKAAVSCGRCVNGGLGDGGRCAPG